jgi:hypothetical protein
MFIYLALLEFDLERLELELNKNHYDFPNKDVKINMLLGVDLRVAYYLLFVRHRTTNRVPSLFVLNPLRMYNE